MDAKAKARRLRDGVLGLTLVGFCLAQCGCLLALAGAGAGAGAYAYHKGQTKGCFRSDFATAWHATRNAITSMGMPLTDERYAGLHGTIESCTGDGRRIVIKMHSFAAPVPNDGFRTEVCVRVGMFGDEAIGERILTEVGMRISPPGHDVILAPPQPAGPPPGARASAAAASGGPETLPPPAPKMPAPVDPNVPPPPPR